MCAGLRKHVTSVGVHPPRFLRSLPATLFHEADFTAKCSVSSFACCIHTDAESQALEVEDQAPMLLQTGWPNDSGTPITKSRRRKPRTYHATIKDNLAQNEGPRPVWLPYSKSRSLGNDGISNTRSTCGQVPSTGSSRPPVDERSLI